MCEQEQQRCRRQSERHKGNHRAEPTSPDQSQREAELTARRTGQELAQRHELCVLRVINPAPAGDELTVHVPQVRDRPTERGQAEFQECDEDFRHRARGRRRLASAARSGVRYQRASLMP
jgi:hypothetical protein